MKKIWFMLLLICSACAFTACSDDDKTPEFVAPTATLPEKISLGKETTIEGKDFDAENAKLILKSETETINPEKVEFTATSVKFILPAESKIGTYQVIVNQHDKDYILGSVEVLPLKLITSVTYTDHFPSTNYSTTVRYTFVYEKSIRKISQIKLLESDSDNPEGYETIFDIQYEKNQISISDEEENENDIYVLDENGKVVNSTNSYEIAFKWEYNKESYLTQIIGTYPEEDDEGNEIFTEFATEYNYTGGNLVEMGGGKLSFANSSYKNNPKGVDIVACIYKFFFSELTDNSDFFPHLLGICGNISTDLPSSPLGQSPFKYITGENGVESISLEDEEEVSTITFEYED